MRILLDEQTPSGRRSAAVIRLREQAGLAPGYKALAEILKQRVQEQMAKLGVIDPLRTQIETELGGKELQLYRGHRSPAEKIEPDRVAAGAPTAETRERQRPRSGSTS